MQKLKILLILLVLMLLPAGCVTTPVTITDSTQAKAPSAAFPGEAMSQANIGCSCNILIGNPEIEVYQDDALSIPLTTLAFGNIYRNTTSEVLIANVYNSGNETVSLSVSTDMTDWGELRVNAMNLEIWNDNGAGRLEPNRYSPLQFTIIVSGNTTAGSRDFNIRIDAGVR